MTLETKPPRKLFVWWSGQEAAANTETEAFSVLAAAEVIVATAAVIYWWAEVRLQPEILLISVVVAPLLLLRSDASVHRGVQWFEQYLDRSFSDVLRLPEQTFRSFPFQASVLLALCTGAVIAFGLGCLLFPTLGAISVAVRGFLVGYLATQLALSITVAVAAKEVAAVAERTAPAIIVASLLVGAIVLGLILSQAPYLAVFSAVGGTIAVSATAVLAAPKVMKVASRRAESRGEGGGIAFARALLRTAPYPFAAFFPGLFFGGWLRSVLVRFAATAVHLPDGFRALPNNWWRTLFVVDFTRAPEIVPGYKRSDAFNVTYLKSRIRDNPSFTRKAIYSLAFMMMFAPAYLYRFSIKSTFWFYWPIIYLVDDGDWVRNPKIVSDRLCRDRVESYRRWLLLPMVAGLFYSSTTDFKSMLPAFVIHPLEYGFLIDIRALRPWQWLNLISAGITFGLFMYADTFRTYVEHSEGDHRLQEKIRKDAWRIEFVRRVRFLLTISVLIIAFVHALLWATSIQTHLSKNALDFLTWFFGDAIPKSVAH